MRPDKEILQTYEEFKTKEHISMSYEHLDYQREKKNGKKRTVGQTPIRFKTNSKLEYVRSFKEPKKKMKIFICRVKKMNELSKFKAKHVFNSYT